MPNKIRVICDKIVDQLMQVQHPKASDISLQTQVSNDDSTPQDINNSGGRSTLTPAPVPELSQAADASRTFLTDSHSDTTRAVDLSRVVALDHPMTSQLPPQEIETRLEMLTTVLSLLLCYRLQRNKVS